MKRYNALYNNIIDIKNIDKVYKNQIRKNTKNKVKLYKFEEYYTYNICHIKYSLEHNYELGKYNIFLIKDPKYRIIMSQDIRDKLINHLVGNELIKVLELSLINNNIATRKGKGTHSGIRLLKKYLNELKSENVYALKFDISKYFYNIDHDILKDLYYSKIKDKNFLKLLDKIIDSTNEEYVNKVIIKLVNNEINKLNNRSINLKEKKRRINELKHIPLYKKGKGLPIGNLTSQILAIYYLNELDQFILEKLKVKYIRYMDDGILLCNSKVHLKHCLDEIEHIIDKYKLKFNNKTCIVNVSKNGVDFLGFRFYIFGNKVIMKVRHNIKRRFKSKVKLIKKGVCDKKTLQIINSYKSHLKWGGCYLLIKNNLNYSSKRN